LPSELFQIVVSFKIVSRSMTFKHIHKITIIHKKFLVLVEPTARDRYKTFGDQIWPATGASLI